MSPTAQVVLILVIGAIVMMLIAAITKRGLRLSRREILFFHLRRRPDQAPVRSQAPLLASDPVASGKRDAGTEEIQGRGTYLSTSPFCRRHPRSPKAARLLARRAALAAVARR
jgi:hypothetical protein